jgi:hypothetical protein
MLWVRGEWGLAAAADAPRQSHPRRRGSLPAHKRIISETWQLAPVDIPPLPLRIYRVLLVRGWQGLRRKTVIRLQWIKMGDVTQALREGNGDFIQGDSGSRRSRDVAKMPKARLNRARIDTQCVAIMLLAPNLIGPFHNRPGTFWETVSHPAGGAGRRKSGPASGDAFELYCSGFGSRGDRRRIRVWICRATWFAAETIAIAMEPASLMMRRPVDPASFRS